MLILEAPCHALFGLWVGRGIASNITRTACWVGAPVGLVVDIGSVLFKSPGHTEVWYNTSGFDTTQVFLDAAAARNMRVILSLKDFYNATKHPGIKAVVSDTVDRFKVQVYVIPAGLFSFAH